MFDFERPSLEKVVDIILCFRTQRFGHIALRVEVYGQGAETFLGIVRGEVDRCRSFGDAAFLVDDRYGFHGCSVCVDTCVKVGYFFEIGMYGWGWSGAEESVLISIVSIYYIVCVIGMMMI